MNYIVEEIRKFTETMVFKWFYPKRKMKKEDFRNLLNGSQYVSALVVCDYLVYIYEKENVTLDELMGDIHKIRLSVWNQYCKQSDGVRRVKDVTDVMGVEMDLKKLVKDPKLEQKVR